MSLNLLTFAIPFWERCRMFRAEFFPPDFSRYENAPESIRAPVIKEIVERVLTAENQPGRKYYKQIQQWIQYLPDSSRNIQGLIAKLGFKAIIFPNLIAPNLIAPMGICGYKKIYLLTSPQLERENSEVLPFMVAHELGHFLEPRLRRFSQEGWVYIASLIAAFVSTSLFSWTLLPSAIITLITRIATEAFISYRRESEADDFAIQHCTSQEREAIISYFQKIKSVQLLQRIYYRYHHPPIEVRIAKIRASLQIT